MNTLDELKAKASAFKLVSDVQRDAAGEIVDGGANAETVEYRFDDGETLTISREVLRDRKMDQVEFRS